MYTKINEKDSAMKLGAIYSKEKTTFTLFSPVADSVFVIFYDKGNDSAETGRLEMMRGEGELRSIFSATAEGNLDGVYYTYEVHTADGTFSSHDPYARACGVNGHRSMVIDLSKTDPDGFADEDRPKLADPMSMVITEVSVADVSAGASAHSRYPGKFKAFTEDKTLSYFKDMGVTHLQLMPSYDFASIDESDSLKEQYNWGYDPYNYNVPEGSYSTDPFNGAVRVREYKEMVHSIHEAGLGVIMDVVYNHTFNVHDSCFYKTAGNYFYRMLDAAKYSDASACGNEIASEKPMVRKYIIDSLCYWAQYVDGFRCDVASTVPVAFWQEARRAVEQIRPGAIWLGESVHLAHIQAFREMGFYAATDTELFTAFDILYPYDLWPLYEDVTEGRLPLSRWFDAVDYQEVSFESGYNKLRCLENHDTSRAADRFPERKKLLAWTALNYFMKVTILLYAGQEVCEKHTPSLFEKEPVDWNSGEDISGYLAKLAAIKKKLPTDELFRIGADDTQGIVTASYIGPATRAVGIFPLEGNGGTVAVPLPDGAYTDALSGKAVTVADGMLTIGEEAVILLG